MNNSTVSCMMCDVASGKIVPVGGFLFESATWTINHMLHEKDASARVGWFVGQPHRHVAGFQELTVDELVGFSEMFSFVNAHIIPLCGSKGKLLSANFSGDGQTHLHVHLIPFDPTLGPAPTNIFDQSPCPQLTVEEVCARVRS